MAQLDQLIGALIQHKAEALLLCDGEKPALLMNGTSRPVVKTALQAEQVTHLVSEIAPADRRTAVAAGLDVIFEYNYNGTPVDVEVSPGPRVVIRSAVAAQPQSVAAQPQSVAAPSKPAPAPEPAVPQQTPQATSPAPTTPSQASPPATRPAAQQPQATPPEQQPPTPTPQASTPGPPVPQAQPAVAVPAANPTPPAAPAPQASPAKSASAYGLPSIVDGAPAPPVGPGGLSIDTLFRTLVEMDGSDLHLSSDCEPMVRVHGEMKTMENLPVFDADAAGKVLLSIAPDRNRVEFAETGDTDFAYEIDGLCRFRCNLFMDRKGPGGVFRVIPSKILTADDLGLSQKIQNLCNLTKGLVLVTGPTGSGKSTTLSAMVDLINRTRMDHIITIEDPIEFVHPNRRCLVNQREVHMHTKGFKNALRAALREDPDVVLVGELRDLETVAIAIETAETGHLVFGTLHTSSAVSTVDRIIDQFPADQQDQIRIMLSESLRAVIAQVLCKKIGGGRCAAMEVLMVNPAVSNLIREGKTFQIPSIMQTGRKLGNVLLNSALLELVEKKLVEPEEAYLKAIDKQYLLSTFKKKNIRTDFANEEAPREKQPA